MILRSPSGAKRNLIGVKNLAGGRRYDCVQEQDIMSVIARLLLLLAAPIAALFVARDALNFSVVQMMVASVLFAILVAAAAFWPRRRSGSKP